MGKFPEVRMMIDLPPLRYAPVQQINRLLERLLGKPRPTNEGWTDAVAELRTELERRKQGPAPQAQAQRQA